MPKNRQTEERRGPLIRPLVPMRTSLKTLVYTSASCGDGRHAYLSLGRKPEYVDVANRINHVEALRATMRGDYECYVAT
jgi:hypothetical protein